MSLSISDVLALPRLEAMRLRAGEAGRHRIVRWPHVAENLSIAEGALAGELVFVTGINPPRDEARLLQLVRDAHTRSCAGLVVLAGPLYIRDLPDSVQAEADQLGLPLIEQPYELPLMVVTEAIGSALVRAQFLGNARQQLIEQLLDGSVADPTVMAHRAERLAIDLEVPRQVLVVYVSGTAELFRSRAPEMAEALLQSFRQEVAQRLARQLGGLGQPLPVLSQAEQWIALLPAGTPAAPARNRLVVEQLLQSLNVGDTPLRVLAGLGSTCRPPAGLPTGLGQARQALVAAQAFPERLGLCCFDELGVFELLVAIRDHSLLDRFVHATLGPLLHHDGAHHAVLTRTLEAWMHSNGNLVAAAQRLDVHRNTLKYRMQQIQSLIGLDPDNPQHRLNIAVALMIWRLSAHHTPSKDPA